MDDFQAAFTPSSTLRECGKLSIPLEAFEPPPIPVNVVYPGGGLQPLKVRAFLDFAAPRLKARLAADLSYDLKT